MHLIISSFLGLLIYFLTIPIAISQINPTELNQQAAQINALEKKFNSSIDVQSAGKLTSLISKITQQKIQGGSWSNAAQINALEQNFNSSIDAQSAVKLTSLISKITQQTTQGWSWSNAALKVFDEYCHFPSEAC